MISESTRFLAQPSEMRLTLIMRKNDGRHGASDPAKSKNGPDNSGPPGADCLGRERLLLFRSDLRALFLALQIGSPAFAFDKLVELLAHGCKESEGSIFQS